jgi:hypothetical protein
LLSAITANREADMDDGGHRENGRHKADQYKTAQGQVSKSNFPLTI